jgi:hypothetical protein
VQLVINSILSQMVERIAVNLKCALWRDSVQSSRSNVSFDIHKRFFIEISLYIKIYCHHISFFYVVINISTFGFLYSRLKILKERELKIKNH